MRVLWFTNTPSLGANYLNLKIIGGGWIESLEVELTKVIVQLLNIILISLVLNYDSQIKMFTS